MAQAVLGIIGGSGLYEFEALTDRRWESVSSPFGEPSDQLLFGTFGEQQLVFLPRHGRGHVLPPSEINYRANIDALKRAGVTDVLSLSAVGSFRDDLARDISCWSTSSSTAPSRATSRSSRGLCCPRHLLPPGVGAPAGCAGGGGQVARAGDAPGRCLPVHGRSAVFHLRREHAVPVLGLRRDRHDQHARSETGPGGRTALRHGGNGHRLRLLAPRS